ncbi:DEAD/DEAH box helicase [Ferrimonas pelagia]|uniref:AAA domain-containing protein n=1 Tax=Ferrimonas pelagia TaxID=1177826 RepID=A0ABP9EVM8_9GAMM
MTELLEQKVPFWPEDKISNYGSAIPLLHRPDKHYRDNNWPQNGPSEAKVFSQLSSATKAWTCAFKQKNRDNVNISLLVGNYKVTVNIVRKDGRLRLWINRIFFASNRDRQEALEKGALVSFAGIKVLTGIEFGEGFERKERRYESGSYVQQLLDIIHSPWNADGEEVALEKPEEDRLSDDERESLELIRSFIDSEYELEQITAQQTMPFTATSITARSRATTYRLHYEVHFDEFDYARLLELKPSLLVLLSEMQEPTEVLFEVTDLTPIEKKPVVYVSVERQTASELIPTEAMLGIAALPTLKKVRNAVVDALEAQATKNPWLLSVAAGSYRYSPLKPEVVPLPPSKFPPTPSQVKAINSGAGSDDFTLVLGPPGTGKTTVILQWVKYFAAQGKRVLVTSQNNKAVDNVLERLAEEDDFECLRIGSENKISSSLEAIMLDNKAAELQEKMFAQANEILSKLSLQKSLLERLIKNAPEILVLIRRRDSLRGSLVTSKIEIELLQNKLVELVREISTVKNELQSCQLKIDHVSSQQWPILKSVGEVVNSFRLKSIRKKLGQEEERQALLEQQHAKTQQDSLGLELTRSRSKQELESAIARITGYFGPSESVVPEIIMPGTGSQEVTCAEVEELEALAKRLDNVLIDLTTWFDKLKSERQQALYKMLIENVNVVGATCIGINTKALFRELDFDVVIVDESGQIQLHNLIVPLSRAPKAILVGDHKQLPPVVSDEVLEEVAAQGFEEQEHKDLYRLSWFEHLWNNAPDDRKIMLDTQFRCPSMISDFVSEAFYEGNYFAGVGMDKKQALLSFCPKPMVWVDTCRMANKAEQATNQDGRTVVQDNACETRLIIEVLQRAIQEKPELAEQREIGVIVPYANHVKTIQKAIRRQQRQGQLTELTMPLNELVASVDSFQGQERDLIIFTFTRSNPRGQVGFLADWRRLNVAQTRAKKQLVMIGDSQTLMKGATRKEARDSEFKLAMQLLRNSCVKQGALLDAVRFSPPSAQRAKRNGQQRAGQQSPSKPKSAADRNHEVKDND